MVRTWLLQVGNTTALSTWQPDIWLHVPSITFTYFFLIFICLAVLGLSCSTWGLCCSTQTLQLYDACAQQTEACGLSCSKVCGIPVPPAEIKPMPPCCKVPPPPLNHQGSPPVLPQKAYCLLTKAECQGKWFKNSECGAPWAASFTSCKVQGRGELGVGVGKPTSL